MRIPFKRKLHMSKPITPKDHLEFINFIYDTAGLSSEKPKNWTEKEYNLIIEYLTTSKQWEIHHGPNDPQLAYYAFFIPEMSGVENWDRGNGYCNWQIGYNVTKV